MPYCTQLVKTQVLWLPLSILPQGKVGAVATEVMDIVYWALPTPQALGLVLLHT